LEEAVYPPAGQFFKWDRKAGSLAITGADTHFVEVNGRPAWFSQKFITSTSKAFNFVTIDPVSNNKLTATLLTDEKQSKVGLSKNFRCAAIYDTTASGTLRIYDFSMTNSDITVTTSRTVPSALYSGITLTDAWTTFDVSDDCNAVRINSVVLHWNPSLNSNAGGYAADILPTGRRLVKPACS
jgi:hypothetical protein